MGHGPDGTLTAQDARELLAGWATSGATLADFARSKGMHPQRLGWWKTKFARQSPPPRDPAPPRAAPAAPTALPDAPFEVVLGARTLRVPQRFAAPALAELLAVLEAAGSTRHAASRRERCKE